MAKSVSGPALSIRYKHRNLTRLTPCIDIDITDPDSAEAIKELARERLEERGYFLVRTGKAPKCAVLLRTDKAFPKIVRNLTAPNGAEQKLEILCAGQQVIAFGEHPGTGQPYTWHGGEPGKIALEDLPYVTGDEMVKFADDAVALLVKKHGYIAGSTRKAKANGNGHDTGPGGVEDWSYRKANIQQGREYHDTLCAFAAKLIASGMAEGATINLLRAEMKGSSAPHDERWQERYDDIPRIVASAGAKYSPPVQATTDINPVDLWNGFGPPILPKGLLPKEIEDYAFAQGRTMGADPGGIAMAALAVCAAATPDRVKLVMKPGDGWTEVARLWVGLVGLPSTKKSPIISTTMGPLNACC